MPSRQHLHSRLVTQLGTVAQPGGHIQLAGMRGGREEDRVGRVSAGRAALRKFSQPERELWGRVHARQSSQALEPRSTVRKFRHCSRSQRGLRDTPSCLHPRPGKRKGSGPRGHGPVPPPVLFPHLILTPDFSLFTPAMPQGLWGWPSLPLSLPSIQYFHCPPLSSCILFIVPSTYPPASSCRLRSLLCATFPVPTLREWRGLRESMAGSGPPGCAEGEASQHRFSAAVKTGRLAPTQMHA